MPVHARCACAEGRGSARARPERRWPRWPPRCSRTSASRLEHIDSQAREIERKDAELHFKTAKLEKITFELARLKAWKFGAKTEAMSAEQRRLFEETLAEDEADLQAQLRALQGDAARAEAPAEPRQRASPGARHCPSTCAAWSTATSPRTPTADAAAAGRWCAWARTSASGWTSCRRSSSCTGTSTASGPASAARCWCRSRSTPQIIDGGMPAAGLVAHTLISRFVDHLPYYRQEQINARSGVHTPRSTLAALVGRGRRGAGAAVRRASSASCSSCRCCMPTRRRWRCSTPARARPRRPTSGPMRAARSMPTPGVVYDFCPGRGSQYPVAFLARSGRGTLGRATTTAATSASSLKGAWPHRRRLPGALRGASSTSWSRPTHSRRGRRGDPAHRVLYRARARCAGHERRRIGSRRAQQCSKPLWEDLHAWLELERARVPDGSGIAGAIDYSLNRWTALTRTCATAT